MSEVRVHADFTVKDEESFLRDTRPMIEATQVANIIIVIQRWTLYEIELSFSSVRGWVCAL